MMDRDPQTLGASSTSLLSPPCCGPPAILDETPDTSDTPANRPSRPGGAVDTGATTPEAAPHLFLHGATMIAEDDRETVDSVYHAPPSPDGQPHASAQSIILQRSDNRDEHDGLLRSLECNDGLSDDDMDIEMTPVSDILPMLVDGQNVSAPRPTISCNEVGMGFGGRSSNSASEWSPAEWRAHTLGGSAIAPPSACLEGSQKPQDHYPCTPPPSLLEGFQNSLETALHTQPPSFLEGSWKPHDTFSHSSPSQFPEDSRIPPPSLPEGFQNSLETALHTQPPLFLEGSWKPHDTFSHSSPSQFLEDSWNAQKFPLNSNDHIHYQQPQAPRFCIICKIKPPYSKNGKSYPTCGLTCAAKMEKQKEREAWESGRPSSYPGSCVVCHARPKHVSASSGRVYPTCGLRCAAQLDPPKSSAGKYAVGKKHPKLATATSDQCSIAYQDKVRAALTNTVPITCYTCLACWTTPALLSQPFCSDDCEKAMESCAPALIEMPRGHFLFEKYHKQFQTGRDTTSQWKAVVQHIYFFAQAPTVASRYESYRAALQRSLKGRSSAETEGWVAITRKCNVGDSGSVQTCRSPTCDFCNMMLTSFAPHTYPQGIPAALTAPKASEALRNIQQGPTKALLFVRVIHKPRLTECVPSQLVGSQRSPDDVVAVIPSRSQTRTELRVYNFDAILPLGLLVYSER